ncbi:MAG: hypothetical protein LUD07_13270 [Clostridiales bacterium]|nr:hypothetical protein [Clostridiales bacterium]
MLSNIFSDKKIGFYLSGLAAILSLVTAIIYQLTYYNNADYSSSVFAILLIAFPAALILTLLRLEAFVPAIVTLIIGIGALRFIYAMYLEMSVVLVGIDKSAFDPQFIVCSVLMILGFIMGEISIYTPVK